MSDEDDDDSFPKDELNQIVVLPSNSPTNNRRSSKNQTLRATQEDLEYYEATLAEREQFLNADQVVRNSKGQDTLALLAAVKQQMAREAAALAYLRDQKDRIGADSSAVSAKRIEALKKISDIELEMRKIGVDQIDVHSEKMQRIFQLWIDTIREVSEQTLRPEDADLFFNRLTTAMAGWMEKAQELVR